MTKEFIPYEQALALKELGFDEPCLATYHKELNTIIPIYAKYTNQDVLKAPLYQQAFRWFREKGYDVKVQKESDGLYFGFYWTGAAWIIVGNGTYEQAELACLIILIEIVKTK